MQTGCRIHYPGEGYINHTGGHSKKAPLSSYKSQNQLISKCENASREPGDATWEDIAPFRFPADWLTVRSAVLSWGEGTDRQFLDQYRA